MLALVIVLLVTNVATIGALIVMLRVRLGGESPAEASFADALPPARGMAAAPGDRGRRVISIEIHNPIELAGRRNRMFGIAGSFVPDLTRRVVYDQTAKLLRTKLAEYQVVADVRVHAFGAVTAPSATGAGTHATAGAGSVPTTAAAAMPLTVDGSAGVVGLAPLAAEFDDEDAPDRLAD
jgi:hypothetical protein